MALRIAVIGGGIGGLAAAVALLREGHEVVCFERVATLREVGAGVQISPNAAAVLHRLGLAEAVERVAVRPSAVLFRRWDDGRVVGRHGCNPEAEQRFGAPYYTFHRADLHDVLRAAVPSSAIALGSRCVGVEQSADCVEVHFEDGARHTADVVVGADGFHSILRRRISADAPRFSGSCSFRGVVPATEVPSAGEGATIDLWLGPNRSGAAYPVSSGRLVTFTAVAPMGVETVSEMVADGRPEEVIAAFAGWHEDFVAILRAAKRTVVLPLYDRAQLPRWVDGRVALLGDAAHPMLPFFAQGAAQAIEDALALAVGLRGAERDSVAEGLQRYEGLRRERTEEVRRRSAENGALLQLPDGESQSLRDMALGAMTLESHAWLFSHRVEA
jgi:salicylate hydroxylase